MKKYVHSYWNLYLSKKESEELMWPSIFRLRVMLNTLTTLKFNFIWIFYIGFDQNNQILYLEQTIISLREWRQWVQDFKIIYPPSTLTIFKYFLINPFNPSSFLSPWNIYRHMARPVESKLQIRHWKSIVVFGSAYLDIRLWRVIYVAYPAEHWCLKASWLNTAKFRNN